MKMSLDLLLAVCVPLGLAVWFTAEQGRKQLEQASRQNLEVLAGVTSTQLDQLLLDSIAPGGQGRADDDVIIARCLVTDTPTPALAEDVQRDLQAVVETNPDLASIFILNREAVGLAGTSKDNVNTKYTERQYATEALAGHPFISDMIVGKNSGEPGVYISVPVREVGKQDSAPVVGAVVIKLDGRHLWKIVDRVKVGEQGFAVLADRDGVVLSHPDKDRVLQSFAPLAPAVLARIDPRGNYRRDTIDSLDMPELQGPAAGGATKGTANFTMAADGGRRAGSQASPALTEKPWRVFVVEPEAQFAAATTKLLRRAGTVRPRWRRDRRRVSTVASPRRRPAGAGGDRRRRQGGGRRPDRPRAAVRR